MSTVRILNEQTLLDIPLNDVQRMAKRLLDHVGRNEQELSVVFTDDSNIRRLNRDYLRRDKPTNVLSLSQQEDDGTEVPGFENRLLGDVIVSVETCARNAVAADIPPLEEVVFCLIHGIVHLLGYDHEGPRSGGAAEMEKYETDLFARFGSIVLGG